MPEGDAARYRGLDLYHPVQFRQAVQNVVNTARVLPKHDLDEALNWYDREHDTVTRNIRGTNLSHRQGSGITAAVSSGMDYEGSNTGAIGDVGQIKKATWNQIYAHQEGIDAWRRGGRKGKGPPREIPALKGTGVAQASAEHLIKAHRIWEGEDPEDVLTSPKHRGFFKSLEDPQAEEEEHPEHDPVAIDYRQHDLTHGKILPANFTRSAIKDEPIKRASRITTAQPGDVSGYAKHAEVLRAAADVMGVRLRKQMQAGGWVGGKAIETEFGKYSKIPVPRIGQPYFLGGGAPNVGGRQFPGGPTPRRGGGRSAA